MNFKKLYKSRSEFKERNRAVFLSAYKTKYPSAVNVSPAFRYFIRGAVFGAAMVVVLTAGATYADQKNVGVSSVLYPLKKTSEAVKVVFTSGQAKEELHLELAERRLEEIKSVREKTPENPKINSLSKELETEIQNSILKIEFPKNQQKANPSAKINPESKKEGVSENLKVPPVAGVPSMTSATQITSEGSSLDEEKEGEDGRRREGEDSKRSEKISEETNTQVSKSDETSNLDDRQKRACEFWKEIIEEKDFAVTDLINKTPEIIEKYKENCESFSGSFVIKADSSEVEVEIED